ncbi:MAG: tol-pal system protein YbgF [Elusimicrobiota bacterium]|nr:tol-pal system protein YbgF [Elusimicrobiota bacterium]
MRFKSFIHLSLLTLFIGCIATSREITDLRDDIGQLRVQMNNLQRNQADLSTQMDILTKDLSALNEKLDDTKYRMSLLSQRMDDIHSSLSQRVDILSEQLSGSKPQLTPTPSELYKLSYSDYTKGKYDLAIVGFRNFLEKYPDSELASNAQYYLAETYFSKKEYEQSIREFDGLIREYSYSDLVVSAKYKKALALIELKKTAEAKVILQEITTKYPQSPEAGQSKEKLRELGER